MLTSVQARQLLVQKECKKREKEQEKERRKLERQQKKLQREELLRKKQAEKATKQVEKAAEKAAKQKDNSKQSRKCGASGCHVRDTFRKRMCTESEIVSSNECIVCLGDYSDNIDSETGKLLKEWIQCTNHRARKASLQWYTTCKLPCTR